MDKIEPSLVLYRVDSLPVDNVYKRSSGREWCEMCSYSVNLLVVHRLAVASSYRPGLVR